MKPAHNEMHPSKAHQSTAEPSSAARLGFTDIRSASKRGSLGPVGQDTPSKINIVPSSDFSFSLAKPVSSVQFTSEAQRIMDELQEKAAMYKADLQAKRDAEIVAGGGEAVTGRRFARPSGRFSAAHTAEFNKMESIAGHASAWRAKTFTPVIAGVKRSPSKASLVDATPTKSPLTRSPSKTKLNESTEQPRRNLKRKSSAANLDRAPSVSPRKAEVPTSPAKARPLPTPVGASAKRMKKLKEDDASTSRPGRPTASAARSPQKPLPKAPSVISRLLSPTKSSRAHTSAASKPTTSVVTTPSKPTYGSLSKPVAALKSPSKAAEAQRRILTPNRFQKVKSILRAQAPTDGDGRSAIPQPRAHISMTPAPPRTMKELPPVPLTTPRRKLTKKVTFTPDTKRAPLSQHSPSPFKAGILKFGSSFSSASKQQEQTEKEASGKVEYPDLSAFSGILGDAKDNQCAAPGTFTFRSDHTIEFKDISQSGFGASPGQSSVRQVRKSMPDMPGSFPAPPAPSTHEDKENRAPAQSPNKLLSGVPHGLSTKKRHRPSTDEEDAEREAAERASKKQKSNHTPLLASRSVSNTPTSNKRARTVATPTPSKSLNLRTPKSGAARTPMSASSTARRVGMSLSRLNMLARPKNRV